MQLDGCGIVGIDAGDHDVLMHGHCLVHELDHQLSADALTAAVGADMNAMFHTVLVARRRAKFAKSPEPGNAGGIFGDNEGKAAGALGIEKGARAVAIDRLLSADDFPMALGRSWLSPRVLANRPSPTVAELNAGSLYAWIERVGGVRIVGGEEYLDAANTSEEVARHLCTPVGTATLVARRIARIADGRAVEFVVLHYRADRYRFGVEWKRS